MTIRARSQHLLNEYYLYALECSMVEGLIRLAVCGSDDSYVVVLALGCGTVHSLIMG